MQNITWRIEFISPPKAVRHCKKCGVKIEFASSGLFRVNAQQKYLDVWLIYKCSRCDSTWNLTIYSRVNPKSLAPELLAGFHSNDEQLSLKYAMDTGLLRKNGAECTMPVYEIAGDKIDLSKSVVLRLTSRYPSDLKVSALLREKMGISRKTFEQMLDNGNIRCIPKLDLRKAKLNNEIILEISK